MIASSQTTRSSHVESIYTCKPLRIIYSDSFPVHPSRPQRYLLTRPELPEPHNSHLIAQQESVLVSGAKDNTYPCHPLVAFDFLLKPQPRFGLLFSASAIVTMGCDTSGVEIESCRL